MKLIKGLKAAARALVSGAPAGAFTVGGRKVTCPHCGGTLFSKRRASLNTAASAATNTEWLDSEATVLVCASCSRLEWFLSPVEPEKSA